MFAAPPPMLKARPATSRDPRAREQERVDEVLDEQHVAHLLAVAVERDRLAAHRAWMRKCATQPWSSVPYWCGP